MPAIVRTTDELGTVERALIENLHRADLTALEEAAAYQQLSEDFGLTHEQIASRVGKSRSAITNTLRLMALPAAVQHLLADGRLSAGHARALLASPDRARQEQLAKSAAAESWSVRMLEDVIRRDVPIDGRDGGADDVQDHDDGAPVTSHQPPDVADTDRHARPRVPALRAPGLLELEHLLADHLATRVAVTAGARRGRVVIEFADLSDLERIYGLMTGPSVSERLDSALADDE